MLVSIIIRFIQLSLINRSKGPTRLLNKKCDLTNNFISIKEKEYIWIANDTLIKKCLATAHQKNITQYIVTIGVLLYGIFGGEKNSNLW